MTVGEIRQALEGLPDEYPVTLFDLDTDERFPIDAVDNCIHGRVEINFLTSEGE